MMRRLALFFVALSALLGQVAYAKTWAFDVYLDDQKIGTHTFEYENNTLTSKADFKVKILLFTAYEYHHTAVEQWQDDCLIALKADTVEDDVVMQVTGEKSGASFVVQENQTTQRLPSCTMTFAYWNPAILEQKKLLNPQNAEYLDVAVQDIGRKTIQLDEEAIEATGYQLLGALDDKPKLNIKVWYDQSKDWVALQSRTPEGYLIDYRLKTP